MSKHIFTVKLVEDTGPSLLCSPDSWEISITLSEPVTKEDLAKAFKAFIKLYEAEE